MVEQSKSLGKFTRQFIAPISLEACKTRLENLAQEPTLKPVLHAAAGDKMRFSVSKTPRTFVSLSLGQATNTVNGVLMRQPDGTTSVVMRAGTSLSGSLIYAAVVFVLANLVATIAILSVTNGVADPNVITTATIILLLLAVPFSMRRFDRENLTILNLIENTLGEAESDN